MAAELAIKLAIKKAFKGPVFLMSFDHELARNQIPLVNETNKIYRSLLFLFARYLAIKKPYKTCSFWCLFDCEVARTPKPLLSKQINGLKTVLCQKWHVTK